MLPGLHHQPALFLAFNLHFASESVTAAQPYSSFRRRPESRKQGRGGEWVAEFSGWRRGVILA